jgi:hypothetical protein
MEHRGTTSRKSIVWDNRINIKCESDPDQSTDKLNPVPFDDVSGKHTGVQSHRRFW